MSIARSLSLFLLALAIFAVSADAQRSSTKRPVPRATPAPKLSPDVAAAKEKVSNQLSNINRFVDLMGPIAQNIEDVDNESKTKTIAKTSLDTNAANKQKVIQAIRGFHAGLVSLEADFKTKPALQKYLTYIQGISGLAAQSEDSALAGKFVAAKDPLRGVSQKLTDTLAAMPKG